MVVLNVIGLFLAVLFGLFTAIMFGDQVSCITEDTSTIDRLKNTESKNKQKSSWELIKDVFGGGFGASWFVPIMVSFLVVLVFNYG